MKNHRQTVNGPKRTSGPKLALNHRNHLLLVGELLEVAPLNDDRLDHAVHAGPDRVGERRVSVRHVAYHAGRAPIKGIANRRHNARRAQKLDGRRSLREPRSPRV